MRDEQSTLPEESKRGRIKGASRREPSERLDVGRPECSGGFSSEHFWIDGLRLRSATKVPQRGNGRAVPECCSSICSTCCQSMVEIPEAVVHERDLSIKCVQFAVSESKTTRAARSRECTAPRHGGGAHARDSSIARGTRPSAPEIRPRITPTPYPRRGPTGLHRTQF